MSGHTDSLTKALRTCAFVLATRNTETDATWEMLAAEALRDAREALAGAAPPPASPAVTHTAK